MTAGQIDFLEKKRPVRYRVDAEWIVQTRPPLVPSFAPSAPGNRYWYGCLLGSLGHEHVREGVTLLDYGCGNGPLGVFLSGKLERFDYYGVEPPGSPHIASAAQHPNIHVGFIGSSVEREAIERCGCAVLGSVFTHLEWKDSCDILDKLAPIARRGAVVFSCFLAAREGYLHDNHYPYASVPTYHYAFVTEAMIAEYAARHHMSYAITDAFYDAGMREGIQIVHRFVKMSGRPGA